MTTLETLQLKIFQRLTGDEIMNRVSLRSADQRAGWVTMMRVLWSIGIANNALVGFLMKMTSQLFFMTGHPVIGFIGAVLTAALVVSGLWCAVGLLTVMDPREAINRQIALERNKPSVKDAKP